MSTLALELPEDASLRTVTSIHQYWLEVLASHTHVTLDAGKTDRIGTATVQLILSLHRSLLAQGGTLIISHASDAVRHAFGALGLRSFLEERMKNNA